MNLLIIITLKIHVTSNVQRCGVHISQRCYLNFIYRILNEIQKLRLSENRVLRRIYGPKREEYKRRMKHTTQFGDSYCVLFTKILLGWSNKENERGRTYSTHRRHEKGIQKFSRKLEAERLLWRRGPRWEDKIIMGKQEVRVWIGLIWLRIRISIWILWIR